MQSDKYMKPVVFLDRDGTLNVEAGYIRKLEDLRLIDGAAQSVRSLNKAGVAAILVTNQSGAARQYYSQSHIQNLHKRLQLLLAEHDAFLDAIYYCPHLPDGIDPELTMICHCRKPAPGLVDLAFEEHPELNRQLSFVVGDKPSDVELAINCQSKSILVKTGYGEDSLQTLKVNKVQPDFVAEDIRQAVDWILKRLAGSVQ